MLERSKEIFKFSKLKGETENEENIEKDFTAINYGYDGGDISDRRGICRG